MAKVPRALFTDGERDAIRGVESMSDETRASHFSRINRKISQRLPADIELVREHHTEYADRIHEVVCTEDIDTRLSELEARVSTVEQRLDTVQNTNETLETRISRLEDIVRDGSDN